MVVAENPFARFAQPDGTAISENPFARFVESQMTPEAEPPKPEPEPWETVNFDQPKAEVRKAIAALPKGQKQKAVRAWQRSVVAKERAKARETTLGRVGLGLSDTVGQFARGIPIIGGALDEMDAATAAVLDTFQNGPNPDKPGLNPIGFNQQVYDEQLAYARERNAAADAEAAKLGELPLIGEVTTGGATKLAGGIASAPLAPVATVMRGATLLPQMVNYFLNGALYGAGHGFTDSEGENRLPGAAVGGTIGGLLGSATAPVAQGVGNAVRYARAQSRPLPQGVNQFEPGSVRRLAEALDADRAANPNFGPNNVTRNGQQVGLGNEGMLADLGDNLRADAGAIANQPGAGQAIIRRALDDRRAGAAGRITQDVDSAMGQPVNVPRTVAEIKRQARAQAGPLYDQFYASNIPITPNIRRLLQRAQAAGAIQQAQRLMAQEGLDPRLLRTLVDEPMTPLTGIQRQRSERVPNGLEFDLIKRGIDDLARRAGRGTNEHRILSNLARDLRNEVDTVLSPNNPQQSIWAQARAVSGEDISMREAVKAGQEAFLKGLTPDQMEYDLSQMTALSREGYQLGARDQVRQIMGNKGTSFGPTGDTGARQALGNDNARRKLELIASPMDADRLVNRLDAESVFEITRQGVTGGSPTAPRLAAQQRYPSPVAGDRAASGLRKSSISGFAAEGVARIANALTGGARNETRMRIAADSARMLVAQGVNRRQIIVGLQDYLRNQQLNQAQARAVEGFINAIAAGARQPLVSGAAGENAQLPPPLP